MVHRHHDTGLVKQTRQLRGEFSYDRGAGRALHKGCMDDGQKKAFLDVVHFDGSG